MCSDSKALTKCLNCRTDSLHPAYQQVHNRLSLADHIYANIPDRIQSSGVVESYFSDHKPVFVCFIDNTKRNV